VRTSVLLNWLSSSHLGTSTGQLESFNFVCCCAGQLFCRVSARGSADLVLT
jgi:hypothetical protein